MPTLKVALINPIIDKSKEYGHFKDFVTAAIPAGIGFLASYIRDNGFDQVHLFDEQVGSLDDNATFNKLIAFQPDIVGISFYTNLYSRALFLAEKIKNDLPTCSVITGSSHPSLEPDDVISTPYIDFVIRGEGEQSFLNFLHAYPDKAFSGVDGLTYKNDGKIYHNKDVVPINNLDQLPRFAYDLFANGQYDLGKYVSSRGCPYKCAFCSSRWISGLRYRTHSPERVVDDIEFLKKTYDIKHLEFYDDNFNINKKRTIAICELLLSKNISIRWKCQTRSDSLDPELLEIMKRAGCYFISLGIESGNDRILKLMRKSITVSQHAKTVKMIKEAKINVAAGFILGYPTETRKETKQTIDFAKKLKLDYARFSIFVPYPGTEALEMVRKEGKQIDWDLINPTAGLSQNKKLAYVPQGRSEDELIQLQKKNNILFWANARIIYKFLKGEVSPYGIPHKITVREILLILKFLGNSLMSLAWNTLRPKNKQSI